MLVTGANGLLGKSVCSLLVGREVNVFGVIRPGATALVRSVSYLNADLSEAGFTAQFPNELDCIIHLAQSSQYRSFPGGAKDVFDVNVAATSELLRYACFVKAKTFIYASSGGVYGNSGLELTESQPIMSPSDLGFYLASKASGEMLAASYRGIFNVIILRPFFIYGGGQKEDMLMARLISNIRFGKPIYLDRPDGMVFNPIHCDDAARAVVSAVDFGESATFNVAGSEVMSIRQVASGIAEAAGSNVNFILTQKPAVRLVGSIAAMERCLHKPLRNFAEFLDEVAQMRRDQEK